MSDSENTSEIPENTSKSLGESQEVENENPKKEEIVKPRKKPPAINKDGTPRKTLTEEQQKARLETLRKGREKANHKRQILKEEALKKAKEHHPPSVEKYPEPETVKIVKPRPKKKTIVIEESDDDSEEEIVVKKVVRKKKPPRDPSPDPPPHLPMNAPPPRPPPVRQETEQEKKKKLKQMKEDLANKKAYRSLFD